MRVPDSDVFVSSVEGHIVPRFGAVSPTARAPWIGCYPVYETKKNGDVNFVGTKWDQDEVVRIPQSEFVSHLKDYSRAVDCGALKLRSAAEYEAGQKAQAATSKQEGEAIEKAAAEEKKAAEKLAQDAAEAKKAAEKAAQDAAAKAASAAPAPTTDSSAASAKEKT